MKKLVLVLLVLVSVVFVGCDAVKEGFEDGYSREGDDVVYETAVKYLGKAENDKDSGVHEVVFNKDNGYVTIKFRMNPVSADADRIVRQANMNIISVFPKMVEVEGVKTVSVLVMLPVNGEWTKGITVEAEKATIEGLDWKTVSDVDLGKHLDIYRKEPWLK